MKKATIITIIIALALTFSIPNQSFEIEKAKANSSKVIDVSIADQRMTIIENYQIINQFPISTGTWDMPTPIGTHQIYNHIPNAYSTPYDLYMPNWMAITSDGSYGIHGLPYWQYSWGRVYEGENHLGWRVSHGCIRLSLANAEWLYDWAPNGTTVIVHNESGIQANYTPPDYAAEIIDQSPSNITLKPGETTNVWVKLKNIGKNWWYNVGQYPIHLGTDNNRDRASSFSNSSWIGANRPVKLATSGVSYGQEATFNFTITAPQEMKEYEEHFRPVAENHSWFNDPDIVWHINVWQPAYSNQWISQSNYPTVAAGDKIELQIKYQNTGSQTWKNSGANPVRLATSHSQDRNSIFYDQTSWLSPNRLTNLAETEIDPGEIGTFNFTIQAPHTPGVYTEYYQLVAEGANWMEDNGVFLNIYVTN
ncbi:MAG: L,D-transpeptidase family protein [Patescibacteria group bacterium]